MPGRRRSRQWSRTNPTRRRRRRRSSAAHRLRRVRPPSRWRFQSWGTTGRARGRRGHAAKQLGFASAQLIRGCRRWRRALKAASFEAPDGTARGERLSLWSLPVAFQLGAKITASMCNSLALSDQGALRSNLLQHGPPTIGAGEDGRGGTPAPRVRVRVRVRVRAAAVPLQFHNATSTRETSDGWGMLAILREGALAECTALPCATAPCCVLCAVCAIRRARHSWPARNPHESVVRDPVPRKGQRASLLALRVLTALTPVLRVPHPTPHRASQEANRQLTFMFTQLTEQVRSATVQLLPGTRRGCPVPCVLGRTSCCCAALARSPRHLIFPAPVLSLQEHKFKEILQEKEAEVHRNPLVLALPLLARAASANAPSAHVVELHLRSLPACATAQRAVATPPLVTAPPAGRRHQQHMPHAHRTGVHPFLCTPSHVYRRSCASTRLCWCRRRRPPGYARLGVACAGSIVPLLLRRPAAAP